MKHYSILFVTVLAALTGLPAGAARLGDAAAPLAIKEWIKGKPVEVKDGKNIYVVEFWATWCLPCKFSIPHLTDLQQKLKDKGVVFVGISSEPAEKVKPFVQQMGTNMDYTVAIDTEDNRSRRGYTVAYWQQSIPVCFIVRRRASSHTSRGIPRLSQIANAMRCRPSSSTSARTNNGS